MESYTATLARPFPRHRRTTAEPMKPAPPVINRFIHPSIPKVLRQLCQQRLLPILRRQRDIVFSDRPRNAKSRIVPAHPEISPRVVEPVNLVEHARIRREGTKAMREPARR